LCNQKGGNKSPPFLKKIINLKNMTLNEFLKKVNGKERDIIEYKGEEALEAVKQNDYALQYVNEQTEEICLEEVKQNGYALKYVNEQTEKICLEAVKQSGDALQYVNEQTEEICLEAVKRSGDALKYVNKNIFKINEEMTLEEVCKELGRTIKIIK